MFLYLSRIWSWEGEGLTEEWSRGGPTPGVPLHGQHRGEVVIATFDVLCLGQALAELGRRDQGMVSWPLRHHLQIQTLRQSMNLILIKHIYLIYLMSWIISLLCCLLE